MPRETSTTVIDKPRRSIKEKINRASAMTMSALALGGLAAPIAKAEKTPIKGGGVELVNRNLLNVKDLSGSKNKLSPEILNRIKASTLELATRPKTSADGVDYELMPSCTAVKVSLPGQKDPFILTAAHCFSDITGIKNGVFTDININNKAEDFTQRSPNDYAILDPSDSSLVARTVQPIATVDRIIIDTNNKDVALLHAVPANPSTIGSAEIRHFEDIPAIPLSIPNQPPLPGTPVALYGEPQSDGFEPIAGEGTYLGRVWFYDYAAQGAQGQYRQIDLVGISPSSADTDNCNYGTSGSMAMLPNGQLLGNLSIRATDGYGSSHQLQAIEKTFKAKAWYRYWANQWENQLGVNIKNFPILCGYTIFDKNTPQELLSGVYNPAPQLMGKVGDPSQQQ